MNSQPSLLADYSRPCDRSLPWVAFGLVAASLIGRAAFIWQPVNSDTAMFVYMGKLVTGGGRMGVDLIDNKLPSVGLLMSAPYRLLGSAWWAYATLGLAMSIVAMVMLTRAAGRCLGPAARWPVLIAAAVWLNFTPAVFGQFQLETVVVFFTSIAGAATLELLTAGDWRDGLLVGLSIGVAMWAKPTAGAMLLAIFLAVILSTGWRWRERLTSLLAVAIGVIIPLAVFAWLAIATGMADALPGTLAQLRDYSNNSTADVIDFAKPLVVLGMILLPVLMLGWVFRRDRLAASALQTGEHLTPSPGIPGEGRGEGYAAIAERSESRSRTLTLPSPGVPGEGHSRAAHPNIATTIFVIAWLLMELLAVISQRRMYAYHFLVLAPPAALLTGLLPRIPRSRSLLLAFGPAVAACLAFAVPMLLTPSESTRQSRIINYLQQRTTPSDSAWMDDDARLLVESDLQPGTRVPLIFLFANSDQTPARLSRQILDDFRARQPRYIVLQQDPAKVIDLYSHHMVEMVHYPARAAAFAEAIGAIQDYVETNYQPQINIDGLVVWQRNDANRATADLRN